MVDLPLYQLFKIKFLFFVLVWELNLRLEKNRKMDRRRDRLCLDIGLRIYTRLWGRVDRDSVYETEREEDRTDRRRDDIVLLFGHVSFLYAKPQSVLTQVKNRDSTKSTPWNPLERCRVKEQTFYICCHGHRVVTKLLIYTFIFHEPYDIR